MNVSRSLLSQIAGGEIGRAATAEGRNDLEHDVRTRRDVENSIPGGAEVEKARARFERLEKIRAAVFERAAGRCEAWFERGGLPERCGREAAVLDCWEDSGGDPQQEGVGTHWALCVECTCERIANHRHGARWRRSFELHCKANRERFKLRITRSA
jgi:hypothetical protein